MGLERWTIELDPEPPEEQAGTYRAEADVMVNPHADYARVRFSDALLEFTDDPEYQRLVIVHEACHFLRRNSDDIAHNDLDDMVGPLVGGMFWRSYNRAREQEVDAVAKLLAPHLPLPPWATSQKPGRKAKGAR
jgi:hypothetical protein